MIIILYVLKKAGVLSMGKFSGDVKDLGIVSGNYVGGVYDISDIVILPGDMSMVGDISQVDVFVSSIIGTSIPIIVEGGIIGGSDYNLFRDNNLGIVVRGDEYMIDDLMIKGYSGVKELEAKFLTAGRIDGTVIYIGDVIASDINLLRVIRAIKDRYSSEVYIIVDGCGTPAMFYNLAILGVDAVVCSYRYGDLVMSDDIGLLSRCKGIKDHMRLSTMVIGRYYGYDVSDIIKLQAIGAEYVISSSLFSDCIESGLDKYFLFDSDRVFRDQVIQQKFLRYGIDIRNYDIEDIGDGKYIKISDVFARDLFDNFGDKYGVYVRGKSSIIAVKERLKDKVDRYIGMLQDTMVITGHYSPMGFSGNVRYCVKGG